MRRELYERVLEITKKLNLSHLSSNLSMLPLLYEVYGQKKEEDIVILSAGHSALALYVILEDHYMMDAEALYKIHGTHPHRDVKNHIYLSTGSLGMGLTVAVGVAIASPDKHVYCLVSDGECAEGCIWEALNFIGNTGLNNITVFVNANGFSAYGKVDIVDLRDKINAFCPWPVTRVIDTSKLPDYLPLERSLKDHYNKL